MFSWYLTAFLIAGIGPVPMTEGSRPTWAHETILAMGFMPRLEASDWLIKTVAAAPSFMPVNVVLNQLYDCTKSHFVFDCGSWVTLEPEAFPAVTVPLLSLTKHGLSLDMVAMLLPCRGNSSIFTSTGPEGQSSSWRQNGKVVTGQLKKSVTFPGWHCDGDNLLIKMSCFLCRLGFVLRIDSKKVLLLSTDSPLLRNILSCKRLAISIKYLLTEYTKLTELLSVYI